ncbi:MAG TPA: glycolate oxidase subunit GlcE [Thermohalobaculum sp.]|nr:glycolate oxidase subunit GlcE [Thermohalobaculum sp.]
MTALAPGTETELAEAVATAAAAKTPLEIRGGGSRLAIGRPVQAEATLATRGLDGITLYEPGALTLVVQAGTRLAQVEETLAAEGQRLPFEPMDHRFLLGTEGEPTVGGMVATAASGPRRVQAGACRDAMLGVRFVNGRGEVIRNGGRVMKNVTGYDLVKLMAGSHGTLGVLTEVAFKVLPAPERALTLVIEGLEDARAVEAMACAMTSPFEVTGAAHLPPESDGVAARTLLRIEGMAGQADYRAEQVAQRLAGFGPAERLEGAEHEAVWLGIRDVRQFAGRPGAVWRLALKPSDAPKAVAAVRAALDCEALYDWAGGRVWVLTRDAGDAGAAAIRAQTARLGGHATLIRASAATRAAVEVFEPEPEAVARFSRGLRARFDPAGILNPGRMRA